jgi:hypothetical protein
METADVPISEMFERQTKDDESDRYGATAPEVLVHMVATFTLSNTFRSGIVPTWFRTGPPYWLPVFFCFLSLKTRHCNFSSFFCPSMGLHAKFFLGLLFIFSFWIYYFFSFLFSRSFDNSILD